MHPHWNSMAFLYNKKKSPLVKGNCCQINGFIIIKFSNILNHWRKRLYYYYFLSLTFNCVQKNMKQVVCNYNEYIIIYQQYKAGSCRMLQFMKHTDEWLGMGWCWGLMKYFIFFYYRFCFFKKIVNYFEIHSKSWAEVYGMLQCIWLVGYIFYNVFPVCWFCWCVIQYTTVLVVWYSHHFH